MRRENPRLLNGVFPLISNMVNPAKIEYNKDAILPIKG